MASQADRGGARAGAERTVPYRAHRPSHPDAHRGSADGEVELLFFPNRMARQRATSALRATPSPSGACKRVVGQGTGARDGSDGVAILMRYTLRLISEPLGSLVDLYGTAIDSLCSREDGGSVVRPVLVASTGTARRAAEPSRRCSPGDRMLAADDRQTGRRLPCAGGPRTRRLRRASRTGERVTGPRRPSLVLVQARADGPI